MAPSTSFVTQVAVTVLVAGLSATLQRLSGFGFALLATPLLATAMPVSRAVVVVSLISLPSGVLNGIELRDHADPRQVARLVGWSIPGLPVGLWVHDSFSDRALRLTLAVLVVIAVLVVAARVQIRSAHAARSDAAGGFISGVLNTSTGTNGPPLVATLAGQDLSPDQFRATLAGVFAFSQLFAMAAFGLDRKYSREIFTLAATGLPLALVGRRLGAVVARRMNPERFRALVLGLLIVTAVVTALRALR